MRLTMTVDGQEVSITLLDDSTIPVAEGTPGFFQTE